VRDTAATNHAATVLQFVNSASSDGIPGNALVSPAIGGSWRRCALDYTLDPARHYSPTVVDAAVLTERREQHAELLQVASAEIDWLYEYIAKSGYALILTDATGIVLYEKTDATLANVFRSSGLLIGADWSERTEGTNGIGTCIAESRSIIVHREEHFLSSHIGLTCFGSPIRDPAGALVAVLDASTLSAHDPRGGFGHTMALVNMSARLIEKCLFLHHFKRDIVFRFHARPEFVNLQHDGAIALAKDGAIIAVDETAVHLLGAASRTELVGRRIDQVFDVRPEELVEPLRGVRTELQPVRHALLGRRFFASLDCRAPVATSAYSSPAT
jgi:transcriptional regulator of acetoin/glycerol metabolism